MLKMKISSQHKCDKWYIEKKRLEPIINLILYFSGGRSRYV